MAQKSSKFLIVFLVVFLAGTLLAFTTFNLSNSGRIRKIVKRSRWKNLANLIVAQAKHETGNFTSRIFKNQNNAFGMKHASKRIQLGTQIGNQTYRTYKSIEQSTKDLLLLYDWNNMDPSIDNANDFAQELKNNCHYEAPAAEYARGMDRFL